MSLSISSDPRAFIRDRRERWQRMETLLTQSRGRRKRRRLTASDIESLGRLYRQITSDLAIARRDFPNEQVRQYLEQLVGRAHPVVYQHEARQFHTFLRFFTHRFPRAFREAGPYTFAAFSIMLIPFALTLVLTLIDPIVGREILPAGALVDKIEQGQSWMQISRGDRGLAASFIMSNNIRVAFIAFAGGILFGVGTVLALVSNGLILGATTGLAIQHGLGGDLISFVSPHGGIEMTVIFMAGGTGLRVGHALLNPGLLTRRAALSNAANMAITLVFGSVPLLMIAGTIEGFVSPSGIPHVAKFAVGIVALVCLYTYLLRAGRGDSDDDAEHVLDPSTSQQPTHSLARAFVSR